MKNLIESADDDSLLLDINQKKVGAKFQEELSWKLFKINTLIKTR